MKSMTVILALAFMAIAGSVHPQATRDFNWIPSGKIDVGNSSSESRFNYWSDNPEIVTISTPFAGGKAVSRRGRTVSSERFTVPVGTWRGGPCSGSLVIRRIWDTSKPATALTVVVDGAELPKWDIPQIGGEQRLVHLFYIVPGSHTMITDERGNARPKNNITVSITGSEKVISNEYAFFITKEHSIIGEAFSGSLSAKDQKPIEPGLLYIEGIVALGLGDYDGAIKDFNESKKNATTNEELARLASRMARLAMYRKVASSRPPVEISMESFRRHYLLGLYCSVNGFWDYALEEFERAVSANPTDAKATYRLAEAMEYNRMPIEDWAPLMGRSGDLYQRMDYNTIDVFVPIQTEAYEGRTGKFSKNSMDSLYRDWRYVEQQVWGASRGAYKLRTRYKVYTADDVKWLHGGWMFCPPEEEWGEWGTYDQSVITAEYGDSGACGPDVGFAGCGYAQIGPTRGWEVLLHEWNHEFDWTSISAETIKGYPVTHDSDGCGKQPIVNMGCGHRSSMYYYVTPAQYRRHETSDPVVDGSHIRSWAVGGMTPFNIPSGLKDDALEKWIVDEGVYTSNQIGNWKTGWQREWDENQKSENPGDMESWNDRLSRQLINYRIMDVRSIPDEADVISKPGSSGFKPYESPTAFIDLTKVFPGAPQKAIAYAETYVWSPDDREVRMWLGMNDGIRVWLNGRMVHRGHYYAIVNWGNTDLTNLVASSAHLQKGWNHLVTKIDRTGGGWGFAVSFTTFDNKLVDGLKIQASKPDATIARYIAPDAGKRYNWDGVKDDYTTLLPELSDEDIRKITGLGNFRTDENSFLFETEPFQGSRVITERDDKDRELNNFLNWDWEAVAAVRYVKDGETRDLLFVRPEYYEEYIRLLPGDASMNILGTKYIASANYHTTPNRFPGRIVLVIDSRIDGDYPLYEEEILEIKTR